MWTVRVPRLMSSLPLHSAFSPFDHVGSSPHRLQLLGRSFSLSSIGSSLARKKELRVASFDWHISFTLAFQSTLRL